METLPQEAGLLLTGRDEKSQKSPVLSMSIQRSLVHALKSKQRDPKVRLPPIITCLGEHGFSSGGFTDPRIIVSLPELSPDPQSKSTAAPRTKIIPSSCLGSGSGHQSPVTVSSVLYRRQSWDWVSKETGPCIEATSCLNSSDRWKR